MARGADVTRSRVKASFMERLREKHAEAYAARLVESGNRGSMSQRMTVRPGDVTDGAPGRPASRRPSARGRVAISLGVSALVHGALLALVSVTIPENRHAAAGFGRSGPTADRPPERTIEVVRIQPPGVLPSGGSAGSAKGAGGQGAARAAEVPVQLPPVSIPTANGSSAGLLAFAASPASPVALPALAIESEQVSRSSGNRGIVRRRPEAGAFPGLGDRAASGSGRGFGGGGTTVAGIWTDCITLGRGGGGNRIGLGLPESGRFGGSGRARGGWPRR